ncbi:cytochrome P450 [Kitasatospora sp. SUK 42]|uniref:cytochrome P450 n=1 Tax=Kitasatospora sp. SUK 42 TaxID=1588882 RepID=UPI0018C9AFA5|nr:cytochrome P450 [Kitasatospora sp. SUK 42]MBV2153057.1 cytochrome P450 [Kitasatospora sp. SUK 42]
MPTQYRPTFQYTSATAPRALPLLGHAPALLHHPYDFVAGLAAHGDLVRLRLGPLDAYVACHPDLVRQLLTEDRTYDKGGLILDKAREVFGNGLATCPAADHRRQRRMLQPAFHRDRLPGYAAMMAEEIAGTTAPWSDGDVIDLPAAMYRLTTAVTARCLFAAHERAGSLPVHACMDAVARGVARRIMLPLPGADRIPTPGNRRFRRARRDLREITRRLIADYRAAGTDHHDLLSVLLSTRDEDGRGLSDNEIHDQVVTFLLAGMETTAATLSWAWTLLAANPPVRERLHTELDTVLDGRPARHEDLPSLPLTGRIVSETLRLHPPAWILSRTVTADTELGGHRVPAGATILYSPYLLHRRADLFPHPGRFDPDRWLTTARPAPGTYTPFGLGARRCIGDTFGTTEAALAIATIASRWTVTPTPHQSVRPHRSSSLSPRPFTATLTRRAR